MQVQKQQQQKEEKEEPFDHDWMDNSRKEVEQEERIVASGQAVVGAVAAVAAVGDVKVERKEVQRKKELKKWWME